MQRTPAGLPWGMPGIGEEIEGAMQQAPQRGRQSMRKEKRQDGVLPFGVRGLQAEACVTGGRSRQKRSAWRGSSRWC